MARVKVDWRSSSKENYKDFCKKHPNVKLSLDEWKQIVYNFNESFREYVLETGDKAKLPFGIGEFAIVKKKRRKMIEHDGKQYVSLPIDWQKTKARGKVIYNFNFHTEGFFFGWLWFRKSARFKHSELWYFKPYRTTSRLLSHFLKTNDQYQHLYKEWKT